MESNLVLPVEEYDGNMRYDTFARKMIETVKIKLVGHAGESMHPRIRSVLIVYLSIYHWKHLNLRSEMTTSQGINKRSLSEQISLNYLKIQKG